MSSRKDFIASIAAVAAAPTAPPVRPAPTVAPAPVIKPVITCPNGTTRPANLTFTFDRTAFEHVLSKDAKHKQCFGIMKIDGGAALEGMMNSIEAYDDFLGEGSGSLQAAGVLYHGASIAFAMNDAVWNEYLIPAAPQAAQSIRKDFGKVKRGSGNPYKERVGELVARGASFFVCHNAIVGITDFVAAALKIGNEKVHKTILAGIVPGALVVPAGVMAINACQEAKFTYIAT